MRQRVLVGPTLSNHARFLRLLEPSHWDSIPSPGTQSTQVGRVNTEATAKAWCLLTRGSVSF
jgi:hypothetical protein